MQALRNRITTCIQLILNSRLWYGSYNTANYVDGRGELHEHLPVLHGMHFSIMIKWSVKF